MCVCIIINKKQNKTKQKNCKVILNLINNIFKCNNSTPNKRFFIILLLLLFFFMYTYICIGYINVHHPSSCSNFFFVVLSLFCAVLFFCFLFKAQKDTLHTQHGQIL